jgi:hypothetical protein
MKNISYHDCPLSILDIPTELFFDPTGIFLFVCPDLLLKMIAEF